MELLSLLLSAAIAIWCLQLRRRIGDMEGRFEFVRRLELRVWSLENPAQREHAPVANDQANDQTDDHPEPAPEPKPDAAPVPEQPSGTREEAAAPNVLREPTVVIAPTMAERLRAIFGDDEWETLVGGSILNKLGAVVLVTGLALFLAYSFSHVGAAGRTSLAFVASAGMLGAGVWVERKARYRVFARGLIGAGWAGLYATAYAMYAIPEARVIESPLVGSIGVLLVAFGMIAHSLQYRSQAATATAYFAAFAALAATPSSPFAVVSLIPLAASMLYLAARFHWNGMALFGLAATYLTCIARAGSGAPIAQVQALFLVYWLLFEGFDLIRTKRRIVGGIPDLLYPANLAGFFGLSYQLWSREAPGLLWLASAAGSVLLFADAMVRTRLRPAATFAGEDEDGLATRLRSGSYEGSVIVSALLAGFAITVHVAGVWSVAALALEAEFLYLAGVWLDSAFLRGAGMTGFAASLARAVWAWESGARIGPAILFEAFVFYLNRFIRKQNVAMTSVAALLAWVAAALEIPTPFIGAAWAVFGIALLQIGLRTGAFEFRAQAWALLAAGTSYTAFEADWRALTICLAAAYICAVESRWTPDAERRYAAKAASAGSALLAAILVWRIAPDGYTGAAESGLAVLALAAGLVNLPAEMQVCYGPLAALGALALPGEHDTGFIRFPERAVGMDYGGTAMAAWLATALWSRRSNAAMRHASAVLGALTTMAALWLVTPDPFLPLLWCALAVTLLEFGFRWEALGVLAIVCGGQCDPRAWQARMSAAPGVVLSAYWFWHREKRSGFVASLLSWTAAITAICYLVWQTGAQPAPVALVAYTLALLLGGLRFPAKDLRIQSYAGGCLALLWTLASDIDPSRLSVSIATAAGFYCAQILARRAAEKWAPAYFSCLGTLLTAAILYGRVSGGMLTTCWALAGLALLTIGFAGRERVLRLQGLALLLVCVLKAFVYDLRNLETVYRILSFVALGLILLGVSWIYTRFRNQLQRLLQADDARSEQ